MKIKILVRAYGSHLMGMGHLYRCQKIIKYLDREKFSITLLTKDFDEAKKIYGLIDFDDLILIEKDSTFEQEQNALAVKYMQSTFQLCLNDQLNSSSAEMNMLRYFCHKIITLDDKGEGAKEADRVINILYPNNPPLLNEINDFKFLILNDYSKQKEAYTFKPAVKTLLINQGAADTWGAIPDILLDLNNLKNSYHLIVLLGPAFQHFQELDISLKKMQKHTVEVVKETSDISSLFMRADLAILGAGNTLFEALSLGIPSIVVTREEKELLTMKILLDKDLVDGVLDIYSSGDLCPLVDELDIDINKREKRFLETRKNFVYSGLSNLVTAAEILLEDQKSQP